MRIDAAYPRLVITETCGDGARSVVILRAPGGEDAGVPTFVTALLYALGPTIAVPAGAALIAWRPPTRVFRSVLLHFATGGLIAVVAVELLGGIEERSPYAVVAGIGAGTALMVGLEYLTRRLERGAGGAASAGVLAVVAVDFTLDGLLLGIALQHDHSLGLVLAVALTLEDLVTGLSVASTLQASVGPRAMLARIALVAIGLPVGAIVGALLGGVLTGALYTGVLALAAVALLFLALEELLREAHETDERPPVTAALFVGLLAFLLLEQIVG